MRFLFLQKYHRKENVPFSVQHTSPTTFISLKFTARAFLFLIYLFKHFFISIDSYILILFYRLTHCYHYFDAHIAPYVASGTPQVGSCVLWPWPPHSLNTLTFWAKNCFKAHFLLSLPQLWNQFQEALVPFGRKRYLEIKSRY